MSLRLLVLLLHAVTALALAESVLAEPAKARPYELHYHARFEPEQGHVAASIEVSQTRGALRLLDLNAPAARFDSFRGDGRIERDGRRLIWHVPRGGGRLRYEVSVDHQRGDAYDARMTRNWALVRLDDLFPPARVRRLAGAYSRATLSFDGPSGWSFETPYGPADPVVPVERADQPFDRPVGWMAAGDLGIRRLNLSGRRIAIAGPKNQDFRRMDTLAFLRWTLPELIRVAPSLPKRVLIVGGSQDMWRGGLSGPGSLYLHPSRPLLSGNATSTLLHELFHVAMTAPAEPDDDWIVEGLAEYYSLVVLLRAGGIGGSRFERTLASLHEWSRDADGRLADPSTGADTARAVLLFRDLDLELARAEGGLDAVVRELLSGGPVGRERLQALTRKALGKPSAVLTEALKAAPGKQDQPAGK